MRFVCLLVWCLSLQAYAASGFAVIAFGSAKQEEATSWLEKNAKSLPHHDAYPRLADSSRVGGMNPGFWVVLVAMPRDKKVADAIGKGLRDIHGLDGVYARPVDDDAVEDAHVVVIDRIDGGVYSALANENRMIALNQTLTNRGAEAKDLGIRCKTEPSDGVVLVYTLVDKNPVSFEIWLWGSQTSCSQVNLKDLSAPITRLKVIRSDCKQGT